MSVAIARPRAIDRGAIAGALVIPLADAVDIRQAGGKAANLSRLIGAGHPVPHGFVVTNDAFQAFLYRNELISRIDALCAGLDPSSATQAAEASAAIAALIRALRFPRRSPPISTSRARACCRIP